MLTGSGNTISVHLVSLATANVVATLSIPASGWNFQPHVTGSHLYFVDTGNVLKQVDAAGTVTTLLTLTTPNLLANAANPAFVISPDETRVAWGYPISASSNGNAYKSRVYVAPLNGTPHVLLNDTDDSHGWALPFAWTAQSIWVARPGFGLGGAGPFIDYSTINSTPMDPATGALGPLSSCGLSDYLAMNVDGAYLCATTMSATVHLEVVTPNGSTTLPTALNNQYGAYRLNPAHSTAVIGLATTQGAGSQVPWIYTGIEVIQVPSGSGQTLSDAMIPGPWIDATSLLAVHTTQAQADSVYSIDLITGATQKLDGDNRAIGVLPSPT